MRFTRPLLAVLSIAGAVRSADPRADETGTLAQEYQKALKESGQVRPNFREAKTNPAGSDHCDHVAGPRQFGH